MFILSVAIALNATAAAGATTLPPWLEHFTAIYKDCLFTAIDRQYETGRFSEVRVLAKCAGTRRIQIMLAEATLTAINVSDGKELIGREFARLDEMVWTIVGHVRARRAER